MTTAQDGGKVVSLSTRRFYPPGNTPSTHFCQRLIRPQCHSATGRIMSLKNSSNRNAIITYKVFDGFWQTKHYFCFWKYKRDCRRNHETSFEGGVF